jgi:hypothetical protein
MEYPHLTKNTIIGRKEDLTIRKNKIINILKIQYPEMFGKYNKTDHFKLLYNCQCNHNEYDYILELYSIETIIKELDKLAENIDYENMNYNIF